MDAKLFEKLLESIRQGGKILRGELPLNEETIEIVECGPVKGSLNPPKRIITVKRVKQ